jgi:peptide/nickel transport system permease protein
MFAFLLGKLRSVDWKFSFILDLGLYTVLLLTGSGWFGALLLTELVSWVFRLAWFSPALLSFILRRMLHLIPTLFMVIALGFALVQLAPGDILTQFELDPTNEPGDVDRLRAQFGLDRHWSVQFILYVWNAIQGDFGISITFKAPVTFLVTTRALNTILLALTTLVLAWGFSIPAGIWAATNQYKWQDQTISALAFVGLAIPNFFLAFLMLFFILEFNIPLPLGGMRSLGIEELGFFARAANVAWHMILPVFVLGTSAMAGLTRVMRANMLEIMNQQYIVTARAKGQVERVVVYRHALRNAINPMITILGFQIGNIMAGAALTETVLSWPGLGRLILQAVLQQDTYLVVGSLVYGVILLVIGNLIADILLALVDPRVRIS